MRKNNTISKISYDPDADVLMYELTDMPIDYAKEVGNFVVHFTKNNIPVLVEILQASQFVSKTKTIVDRYSGFTSPTKAGLAGVR